MESKRYTYEIKKLGEHIRAIRDKRNLSQDKLEALSGVDRAQISRIENGKINVEISTLIKLAEALDAELYEFFPAPEALSKGGTKK